MARSSRPSGPAVTESSAGAPEHGEFPGPIKLIVISGPDRGRHVTLSPGAHVIGKDPGCALELTDPEVSRAHLELECAPDGLRVRDLGSKNGSYYNGARITALTVGPGAVVRVGGSELRFVAETDRPPALPSTADRFGRLVGGSLVMRELYGLLERIARAEASVLITGETGTGKELCAEALHEHSGRAGGPFVICDLAGISRSLIESELFGHVRGAFTGADRDRAGAFAQADGGTLFIDEVGELELELQPRLLRALERRMVKPVGGAAYRRVDVRVIAATNRDLRHDCKAGRFRDDLYHRLAVLQVTVPPLRAHKDDLLALVTRFAAPRALEIPGSTLGLLHQYDWPGNIRELGNVIARALAALGDRAVLSPEILELADQLAPPTHADALGGSFHAAKEQMIARWERTFLTELLARADGKVSEAARRSGIDRPYLHRLLKKHDLR